MASAPPAPGGAVSLLGRLAGLVPSGLVLVELPVLFRFLLLAAFVLELLMAGLILAGLLAGFLARLLAGLLAGPLTRFVLATVLLVEGAFLLPLTGV